MKISLIYVFVICLVACSHDEQHQKHPAYFDLVSYFNQEALRLTQHTGEIDKTVILDGKVERKKVAIQDWKREFSAFVDADINKASWRGLFKVHQKGNIEIYTTDDAKIDIKRVEITKKDGRVLAVKIAKKSNNDLYQSVDELNYFPDSLYAIKKVQKVKLMKNRHFEIIGRF